MKDITTKPTKELIMTAAIFLAYGICITAVVFIMVELVLKSNAI